MNRIKSEYFTLPNIITLVRITGSVALIFIEPLTALFFVIYSICGVSDVLDGITARSMNMTSEFGAKLDSVSDLLFYAVMIIRLMPELWKMMPRIIWYFVGAGVLMRIVSYSLAAVKYKRFASLHTYMNKVTGFAVFAIPYFLKTSIGIFWCFLAVFLSLAGTVEELTIHIISKEYDPSRQSVFLKGKTNQK